MVFKLQSHPNILLKDHLIQVHDSGLSRFDQNGIWIEYRTLIKVILAFHDVGKGSEYFQNYMLKDGSRSKLTRHSEISAIWAWYYCLNCLDLKPLDCLIAYACIASHHGDLDDFRSLLIPDLNHDELKELSSKIDYEELNGIMSVMGLKTDFSEEAFSTILDVLEEQSLSSRYRRLKPDVSEHHWLLTNYLFSLLIWADKYSAIFKTDAKNCKHEGWRTDYPDHYKKKKFPAGKGILASIRETAYKQLVDNLQEDCSLYSINMPTGSGKTLSTLKLALELKEKNPILQRIIYSLPFTSIIDQNQNVFEDILKENGIQIQSDMILAHHHLAEVSYKTKDEYSSQESEFLVETWDSELVVTTFVQLLASFLSVKNGSLKRFHRLANAIIILDEVQNIPHYYWDFMRHTFKQLAKFLKSTIILVTATLPLIFSEEDDGIIELAKEKNKWFASLNRIRIQKDYLGKKMTVENLVETVIQRHEDYPLQNILIILNTIQSSLDVFQSLKSKVSDEKMIYLSSNVIPKHRLERIKLIKNRVNDGLIIVSTQVVEAGVDIDVDTVYRDLAPLDSIIQASGRCNRNEVKAISGVFLFELFKENKAYWSFVYDQTLVEATRIVLGSNNEPIQESDIYKTGTGYYAKLKSAVSGDQSRKLIRQIGMLDLGAAFRYHRADNKDAFKLIDDIPSQTVFIECDDTSTKLLEQYQHKDRLQFKDDYEKRTFHKALLKKMGPFLINVPQKIVDSESSIHIIEKESLNFYYDKDTGFKRKHSQEDFIF